jgi:hypothetical protein
MGQAQLENETQDMLFVRSSLPKADVARIIRQAVAAVDRNRAILLITSMDELLSDSVSSRRFTMSLLGGVARWPWRSQ